MLRDASSALGTSRRFVHRSVQALPEKIHGEKSNGTRELTVSDNIKTFQATEKTLNELLEHPEIRAH